MLKRHKRLVRRLGLHLAALREQEWCYADEFACVELSSFYSTLTVLANVIAHDDERKAEDFIASVEIEAATIRGIS